MKLYSRENQIMVDVTKLTPDGADLEMNAKLMDAYSMPILLRPEEIPEAFALLSPGIVKHLLLMAREGCKRAGVFPPDPAVLWRKTKKAITEHPFSSCVAAGLGLSAGLTLALVFRKRP
ncbi:MAG: hypothetical protein LBL37_02300 [Gracilibacteraceae bacterium]|jgi:hypothetical protein|nr:hypothetical protein [Gracilibacteraceae bacterium]